MFVLRRTAAIHRTSAIALSEALEEAGIDYVFLGGELGGRPADRSCYDADGRVRYDLLAKTDLFDDGIRLVTRHADGRRVCLMCSEKDPLDCIAPCWLQGRLWSSASTSSTYLPTAA